MAEPQFTPEQKQQAHFLALVEMLTSGAMTALGKMVNPGTGKEEEVNLEQARFMIDLLESLQAKTQGNLQEVERKYLEMQLTNLRLTFVDEANRQSKSGSSTP